MKRLALKTIQAISLWVLLFCVLVFAGPAAKGSLVIIGGALSPDNDDVYNAFIDLGGGQETIRIAIIPTASGSPVEVGKSFTRQFSSRGVSSANIKVFPLAVRDDSSTPEIDESKWRKNGFDKKLAQEILKYNAVFFVGGDQLRYRETLLDKEGADSPLLASIRSIYQNGGVLGGTSAGAALMSEFMLLSGEPVQALHTQVLYEPSPSPGHDGPGTWLTRGFHFFKGGIIDQHFLKRGRVGRLLPVLMHLNQNLNKNLNKKKIGEKTLYQGIGIDEDTALVYKNNKIEVVGSSGVLIIDMQKSQVSGSPQAPVIKNIILHYLRAGDSVNLETGAFHINPKRSRIAQGNEYFKRYPLDTNILRRDGIPEMLTNGLLDNRQDKSSGLSFTLEKNGKGKGMKWVFSKTADSKGFLQNDGTGNITYSALGVRLDLFPIRITVEAAHGLSD